MTIHKCYALSLLVLLLAARGGQAAHIFGEDPLHFAALTSYSSSADETAEQVKDRCIIDDFQLFVFFEAPAPAPHFRGSLLGTLPSRPTSCKCCENPHAPTLRAPPAR
ncbi:MAG: hypothetical protein K2N93_05440 [Alistipes sp.]|nr:hypothetical protein [Alistipes sp.]